MVCVVVCVVVVVVVERVYRMTKVFPPEERFGLTSQIQKLMADIPGLYQQAMSRLEQLKGEGLPDLPKVPELPGGLGGGEKPEK